jgi:DNA-binding transcriptional MerR regulator
MDGPAYIRSRYYSPAETARRLGVSTKALRLYEDLGLVRPIRTSTGWRTYGPEQLACLHQVLALKSLGVPLKRIGALLGEHLADLDAVLRLQEAAFRSRIAGDTRRLEMLAAVRRKLSERETLSVDDLVKLTKDTVMGITKTQGAFVSEDDAMAQIRAAGFYPLLVNAPAESNNDHWHDFDAMIFVLEGVNVVTLASTGETLACGPGSRADFPRGVIHRENHQGYRGLIGFSVDPATFEGPIEMPPHTWVG